MCVCIHLFSCQIAEEQYKQSLYQARVNHLSVKLHMSLPGGLQVRVGRDQL